MLVQFKGLAWRRCSLRWAPRNDPGCVSAIRSTRHCSATGSRDARETVARLTPAAWPPARSGMRVLQHGSGSREVGRQELARAADLAPSRQRRPEPLHGSLPGQMQNFLGDGAQEAERHRTASAAPSGGRLVPARSLPSSSGARAHPARLSASRVRFSWSSAGTRAQPISRLGRRRSRAFQATNIPTRLLDSKGERWPGPAPLRAACPERGRSSERLDQASGR